MAMRIVPEQDQPFATIEIPFEKPLPEYNLNQIDQPTSQQVDAMLISSGFHNLLDDARGILMDLLAHPLEAPSSSGLAELDATSRKPAPLEITQMTGAICPGDDEVFRPGLWIIVRDPQGPRGQALSFNTLDRLTGVIAEFVKRLQLA